MTPTTDATVSPFHAVSKRGETDKAMTVLKNLASVSLFQRFQGTLPAKFEWELAADQKIPGPYPSKTVKQRNRQRFTAKYQCLACFNRVETA